MQNKLPSQLVLIFFFTTLNIDYMPTDAKYKKEKSALVFFILSNKKNENKKHKNEQQHKKEPPPVMLIGCLYL